MQRLDHDTVRRMIAEREARAAHGQLVRTLSRTTSPRATAHPASHLLARIREGLTYRVTGARVFLRVDRPGRRSQGAPAGPSIVAGPQRSAAPVGCV